MRLIDGDRLIETIKSYWDFEGVDGITASTVLRQTVRDITNEPVVDAVSVIRCRNCKFAEPEKQWMHCRYHNIFMKPEDFCSKGIGGADERPDN